MSANAPKHRIYPALTGIRAVAAGIVVFFHFGIGRIPADANLAEIIIEQGHLGVPLFFTLSGFLITHTYLDSFKDVGYRRYYIRRVARIMPTYFFVMLLVHLNILRIVYLKNNGMEPYGAPEIASQLTLTQAYFGDYLHRGLATAWTLSSEEAFYASAPFLFFLVASLTRSGKWIKAALCLIMVAVTLNAIGVLLTLYGPHPAGFTESFKVTFLFTYFGRVWEFMIGVMGAVIVVRLRKDAAAAKPNNLWTLGAVASLIMVPVWLHQYQGQANYDAYRYVANIALAFFATCLFGFLVTGRSVVGGFLGSRVMVYLGRTSYALYLVHYIDNMAVESLFDRLPLGKDHLWSITIFAFIVSNIAAAAIYHFVEVPAHRWITGAYKKRVAA